MTQRNYKLDFIGKYYCNGYTFFQQANFNFYNQSTDCAVDGDINNDNIVNILDVVETVNLILFMSGEYLECADMNEDGTINVIDIINLVNTILNR